MKIYKGKVLMREGMCENIQRKSVIREAECESIQRKGVNVGGRVCKYIKKKY